MLRLKAGVKVGVSCVSEGGQIAYGCISGSTMRSEVKNGQCFTCQSHNLHRELQTQKHVGVEDLHVCGGEGSLGGSLGR